MSKGSWLKIIGNEVLDLVYPPGLYCICCGKITDESRTYRLCNDCMAAMSWNTGRSCRKCGRPLAETDPGELCFSCAQREAGDAPYSFDRGYACAGYGACAQALIFALKYGGRADIGDTLGDILYDYMLSRYEADELAGMYDMVIPVPIHRDKLKKRGFNHAAVMGKRFAKRAGIRFEPELLMRTRATLPMKGLSPAERAQNIHKVFAVKNHKKTQTHGARVLLIDDIFTTGSTVNEIASLMKEDPCGAKQVDFLAFAAAGDMVI